MAVLIDKRRGHTATHRKTLQHTSTQTTPTTHLKLTAAEGVKWLCMLINDVDTLQHTATHCNTLQHTATHCNILQRTLLLLPIRNSLQ